MANPRGATRTEISYAIARNQSEITEIWLEIRNQGLGNPVDQREITRNQKRNQEKSRETPPFCLSMRSRPFAHAHLTRNQSHEGGKSLGNQLEISWKSQRRREKSVGNHRNPEISYAEKARVVPLGLTDNTSSTRIRGPCR